MAFLGINWNFRNRSSELDPKSYSTSDYWSGENIMAVEFNGEKTPYELGNPLSFKLDYYSLRLRAWESYLMSDVVQNAIRKYCLWIVGSGLKLQSNPIVDVLKKYSVDLNENQIKDFTLSAESQFRLYATTKESIYSKEYNLHDEAVESLKNALLAGDILCILRYKGGVVSIETIDGKHVQTPIMSHYNDDAVKRGNIIQQGVEVDSKGSHVAYYIRQSDFSYKRILAKGSKTGRRNAWLMYGLKHKKSDVRGMSLLTAVLETAASMDRYKSAALKSAEENANVPYTIEHGQNSDGENPLAQSIAASFGKGKGVDPELDPEICDAIAAKVAKTTKGLAFNMPIDARLKRHNADTDSNFQAYFNINIDIIYATLGIPPEVAMDKFGGAYSGSRAAIKSWEFKIMVDRENILKRQFYKPFFDLWLDIAILENKVQAPGYLDAMIKNENMILEAYRNSRFIGQGVPHIDPVKEATAERIKLGDKLENVPLTSIEQSMENLNTGDFDQNIKKVQYEKEIAKDFIDDGSAVVNSGDS